MNEVYYNKILLTIAANFVSEMVVEMYNFSLYASSKLKVYMQHPFNFVVSYLHIRLGVTMAKDRVRFLCIR